MSSMIRPTETLAQRLKIARVARNLSQVQLAEKAGMKQSDISKLERGTMQKTTGIGRLAQALWIPVEWLELGEGKMPNFGIGIALVKLTEDREEQAQRLSLGAPMIAPKEIGWGDVMTEEAERFTLVAEDDAMAPLLSKGQRGIFSRGTLPVAGKPVLLVDGLGDLYIREYRPRTKDRWQAVALNGGYAPLDSVVDKLDIVAAMVGVLWE